MKISNNILNWLKKKIESTKTQLVTIEKRIEFYQASQNILVHKIALEQNKHLKNSSIAKKCFIIGNGPSLKNQDVKLLKDEVTFVVNSFYLHPDITVLDPHYYVFADPLTWNLENDSVKKWWREIAEKTKGLKTKFFLPLALKDSNVDKLYLHDRQKYYLAFSFTLDQFWALRFNPTGPISYVQNVMVLAIQLAMYMGFKEIILLGADHDWLSNIRSHTHFFEGKQTIAREQSSTTWPYYWWLNAVNTKFNQYKILNNIAQRRGIKIVNASEAGVLDVFPMVRLQDVL